MKVESLQYIFENYLSDITAMVTDEKATLKAELGLETSHKNHPEEAVSSLNAIVVHNGVGFFISFHFKMYWSCSGTSAPGTM